MDNSSLIPAAVTRPLPKHLSSARTYQGIPSIARCGKRLFACWYSGGSDEGPDNFVLTAFSDDNGTTWSDAAAVVEPQAPYIRAFDPVLFKTADERLLLFWAQSYSPENRKICDLRGGVFFSELLNYNAPAEKWIWTASRRIADGIMLNQPVTLSDGSVALPISVWRMNFVGSAENTGNSGTKIYITTDGFKTFHEQGKCLMPQDEATFDEHSIIEKHDGSLWMLIRSRHGNHESFSTDGGRNWSEPVKSPIPGPNSRLSIIRLRSGRLLLINHLPMPPDGKCSRSRLAAMLSDDDGKSWYGNLMLDLRKGVSYPCCAEGDDGFIYVSYDHERYLCGDILLARFTEKDVASGKLLSPDSRLQIIINSTGGTGESGAAVSAG